MGIYVYVTKPSLVATAIVEIDGVQSETEVALYRYAYKPSFSYGSEARNARMRFRSGAQACITAYERSSKAVPAFGVTYDDEANTVYAAGRTDANGTFLTKGDPEHWDDTAKYVGKIVRWVKLPKGITEGPQPKPVATYEFGTPLSAE